MTRWPTASRLLLAEICEASAVLPQVETRTPGASAGTGVHRFFQRANEQESDEAALAEIEDEDLRAVCAAIDLTGLPLDPACYTPEVPFAWNVLTGEGRVLPSSGPRDYSAATEYEIVGTADIVALVGDDAVYVGDLKTGFGYVPSPLQNLQLLFLALAACRAYGRTRAIIEIIRPRENARAWRDRAELNMFDLAAVAERLRWMVDHIDNARRIYAEHSPERGADLLRYTIHDGCKYCPAIDSCRPMTEELIQIATGPEERMEQLFLASMRESAPAAHRKLKGIEAFVKRLRSHLEDYATEHPFDIGDGYVYGMVETKRESLDGRTAWNVIEQRFGSDAAWAAVKLSATKEAIGALATREAQENKRRVKAGEAQKGTVPTVGTHINAEILGEIRKAGGIKAKRTQSVKEFRRAIGDGEEGGGEE